MEPAEFLLSSTIRIETTVPGGISTGTGFFFGFKHNEVNKTYIPAIVTNKHVIKNAITGRLRFSLQDANGNPLMGQYYDLQVEDFEQIWMMHPDENIDLCILPIAAIQREIEKSNRRLYYTTLIAENIPSEEECKNEFSQIEDITVVGYPDGIWDSVNNIPIIRRGITATPLQFNFKGNQEFLVDAAIYPGSSGSPVFVLNQGSYSRPGEGLYIGNRLWLVGIIHAVFNHRVSGDIEIVDTPIAKVPIAETNIPNNLGIAIHARKLLDFESLLQDKE